jgi:hypothetical protein
MRTTAAAGRAPQAVARLHPPGRRRDTVADLVERNVMPEQGDRLYDGDIT